MREAKIILLGDFGVGKRTLGMKVASKNYNHDFSSNIGLDLFRKTILIENQTVCFNIWLPAGIERFSSLSRLYYRSAAAAILVYDVTDRNTFKSLKTWAENLIQYGPEKFIMAIVGNKIDLEERREISTSVGEEYARSLNALFFEISAKTAENVDGILYEIGKELTTTFLKCSFDILEIKDNTRKSKSTASFCSI